MAERLIPNIIESEKISKRKFDFERFCLELEKYKQEHGNCDIRITFVQGDYPLGQRIAYIRRRKHQWTKEQLERLDAIGFQWETQRMFDFKPFYENLLKYKEKFGDVNVPYDYKDGDIPLGAQVARVRLGKIVLFASEIEMLENVGFKFRNYNEESRKDKFDIFYNHLLAYYNEFGNANVPFNYVVDGYPLGRRVSFVRHGRLQTNETQREQLNELDFLWTDARIVFDFERFYKELDEYKNAYGNVRVKKDYVSPSGYALGETVNSVLYNGSIMISEEQVDRLLELGVTFTELTDKEFETLCKHIVKFKKQFGHMNITRRYVTEDGYLLGRYLTKIRYREIMLTQSQQQRLEELGYTGRAQKFDFNKLRSHLEAYKAEFGNCMVPITYECEDGYRLGLRLVAIKHKRTILTPSQEQELADMGYCANIKETLFSEYYENLLEFLQDHSITELNTLYVSPNGYRLGDKTRMIKEGTTSLTLEQAEMLDNLGFVWCNKQGRTIKTIQDKLNIIRNKNTDQELSAK